MKCTKCNNEMELLESDSFGYREYVCLNEECGSTCTKLGEQYDEYEWSFDNFYADSKAVKVLNAKCEGCCPDCNNRYSCKDSTWKLTKAEEDKAFKIECEKAEKVFDKWQDDLLANI